MQEIKRVCAAIYVNVTGAQLVVVQPAYVLGLVEYRALTSSQAGMVVSVESFGFLLMAVAMIYLRRMADWRLLTRILLLTYIAANALSLIANDPYLYACIRFVAGIGGGGLITLGFVVLGLTRSPDRNFGYNVMCVMIYGLLVMPFLPLAYSTFGFSSILILFAGFAAVAFPLVSCLPEAGGPEESDDPSEASAPLNVRLLGLAAIFCYWTAQGAVWSYLFLIGTSAGITEQLVANSLSISQAAGFAGAATVAAVSLRFGRSIPLALALMSTVIVLVVMIGPVNALLLVVVVCVYNYAWNMADPFLLGTSANLDKSGANVFQAIAARKLGFTVGPAIAALVVTEGQYDSVIYLGIVMFSLSGLLIWQPSRYTRVEPGLQET